MATKHEMLVMALAVKQGLIEKEQVQECMDLQQALYDKKGVNMPLAEIAVRKQYLTAEQAEALHSPSKPAQEDDQVSLQQARRIPIFDVHEIIGQGGMATVFLATHKQARRRCALKVLFPKHTGNQRFVERFIREGRLLKAFESENIAKGYEFGVVGKDSSEPLYFMSMEYIDGPSIQDMLADQGPFDEQKAIYVITEAARALTYMQERGVVHRDVKPDNIMWGKDGRVMLVDLGFAAPIRSDMEGVFEDETCGTVQYISPEQAKGQADLDIRADIYSLGATLYHMVVGELPFSGKDSMDIMSKQVMEGLNALKLKGGAVSVHMHYFIEKMMSKERDYRYQSAREVVEDITDMLEGAADLQYNPDNDPGNPFNFALNRSQRTSRVAVRTATSRIILSKGGGTSTRVRPGSSVRTRAGNGDEGGDKDSKSVRKPPLKPAGSVRMPSNTRSVRRPPPRKDSDNE
jgi:eukaryotic-like serine/threonine-protein kinase